MKRGLRHGYTTGSCAAAAARGAAGMLLGQRLADEAEIVLPGGEIVRFRLHGQRFDVEGASCCVIKDAGDDPDITNGAEICATVRCVEYGGEEVVIAGGEGVGRITKPGLAVPVGEWAINPVPRRMIAEAIREVFPGSDSRFTVRVSISITNGEELARKTLNARLGIIGGLSILGTTGIVRPISAKAWTDTIDAALDVALACGCRTVVLSTGRTSEMVAQGDLNLQEESYVMMGDHVGYALRACSRKGVGEVVLAGQFAKLLKIACGHEQTHVASSEIDLRALAGWMLCEPALKGLEPLAAGANTARQVLEESGRDRELITLVCERARSHARQLAPGVEVKVLLAGYSGEVLYSD